MSSIRAYLSSPVEGLPNQNSEPDKISFSRTKSVASVKGAHLGDSYETCWIRTKVNCNSIQKTHSFPELKNKKNSLGNHYLDAITRHDREKFDALIATNQDVNCMVSDRRWPTPLHVACKTGYPYFVERLLQAGADVLIRVGQEKPPLHLALDENRRIQPELPLLVKILLEAGANPLPSKYTGGKTASDYSAHLLDQPIYVEIHKMLIDAESFWKSK